MGGQGSGGHNRKPTALHVLTGTYRNDRHGPADPPAPSAMGKVGNPPPGVLGAEGRRLWRKLRPELERMGLLTGLDTTGFVILCQSWQHYRMAGDMLAREGASYKDIEGRVRVHPAVRIQAEACRTFLRMAREFGLTPSSRSRVVDQNDGAHDEDAAFFGFRKTAEPEPPS